MSQQKNEITDHVSLMVFKDNLAARTFSVPLSWIHRFGVILLGLVLLTVLSVAVAIKFKITLQRTNPDRVQELELELSDLRAIVANGGKPLAVTPGATPLATPPVSVDPQQNATSAIPVATPVSTPFAEPSLLPIPVSPPTTPTVMTKAYLFSGLPLHTELLSDKRAIPIALHAPKVTWQGKVLNVSFNIQYHSEDKGNQQGRIVVLARGPETMMAYPDGVFSRSGASELIVPKRGEYFSVSRFREVRAKFGPMKSQDAIKEVEILLLAEDGNVLIYHSLPPSAPTPTPAPVRPKVETGTPAPEMPQAAPAAPAPSAPAPTGSAPADAPQGGNE